MKTELYPKEHLERLAREAADLDPRSRRIVEALLVRTPETVRADDESGDWYRRGRRPFELATSDLAETLGLADRTVRKHLDSIPDGFVDGKTRTRGWRWARLFTAEERARKDRSDAARARAEALNAEAGTSGRHGYNGVRANGGSLVFRAEFRDLPDDLAREFLAFVAALEEKELGRCPKCGGAVDRDPSDDAVRYCIECGGEVAG